MPKILLALLSLFPIFSQAVYANPDSFIQIKPFSIDIADSLPYTSLHTRLYKRLQYEILPRGIKPTLASDTTQENVVAKTYGSIEMQGGIRVVRFCIKLLDSHGEEIKIIPIIDQPEDDILDLMSLKIRNFLDQNLSGKLRISTIPIDCELLLNGVKVGATPAELLLEKGLYNVKLTHDHLFPYTDTVQIHPGKETELQITMKFEGNRVKPLLISSSVISILTIISMVIDINLHNKYESLPKGLAPEVYSAHFYPWRTSRYILIGSINLSAIGWGATFIQIFRNRSLENKIFGKIN
ncbi:MAG: PEGA domain-containing protein [Fibrobacter sp.]|nr:PEGA domain-containing protein [Fibrobacter sp.]